MRQRHQNDIIYGLGNYPVRLLAEQTQREKAITKQKTEIHK